MTDLENEKPQKKWAQQKWAPLGIDLSSEKEAISGALKRLGEAQIDLSTAKPGPKWRVLKLALDDLSGLASAVLDGRVQESQPRLRTAVLELHEGVQEIFGDGTYAPEVEKARQAHFDECDRLIHFMARAGITAENHSFSPARETERTR
jgi:hypothetical protein